MGYLLNEQPQRVENTGHLFSLEVDGTLKTRLDGIHISNGMAWSANYKIMYYIDTLPRKVYALDYDIDTGNICKLLSLSLISHYRNFTQQRNLLQKNFDRGILQAKVCQDPQRKVLWSLSQYW